MGAFDELGFTEVDLQKVLRMIADRSKAEEEAADRLLALQISNAKKLFDVQVEYSNRQETIRLQQEQEINERLIKMGYSAAAVVAKASLAERLKAIDEEEKIALKGKHGGAAAKVRAEYDEKRKAERELQKEIDKANTARAREEAKRRQKQEEDLYKQNLKHFDTLGNALFSGKR